MKLEVMIKDSEIEEDPHDHRNYTVYVIQVFFNDEKQWTIR